MATAELKKGDVKDIRLADAGKRKIEWAAQQMPVLQSIRKRFITEQPLKGLRVSACLHVTSETANLMIALRDGGADIVLCASNPLSTQDEVAASLNRDFSIPTYAVKGEDNNTYYDHMKAALEHKPQFTMDDGCDLVTTLVTKFKDKLGGFVTFGQAFLEGFLFSVFYGIMVAIFTYIYFTMLSPAVWDQAMNAAQKNLEAKGTLSSEQIESAMNISRKYGIVIAVVGVAVGTPIIGAIISLIGAAIFKKERSPLDMVQDNNYSDPAV